MRHIRSTHGELARQYYYYVFVVMIMIIHSYGAIKSLIIFFTTEFDRLMKKHATQTDLPVILSTSTPTVVVPVE